MTLYKIEDNRMFGSHGLVVISKSLPKARRLFLEAYVQQSNDWGTYVPLSTTYAQLREAEEVRESVHSLDQATFVDGSGLNIINY